MTKKTLFSYFGGKTPMLDDIYNTIRPLYSARKITCFVDVFGGSGVVLLNIPKNWKVNKVYNDLDERLYNVLCDLKDDNKRNKLLEKLYFTARSRQLFNEFKNKDSNDSFEYLYRNFYSFNNDMSTLGFRVKYHPNNQINNLLNNWKYIRQWYIENLDYKGIMSKYDGPTTIFYLDPPYLSNKDAYKHNFDKADFVALYDVLKDIKGYWLMNENDKDFDYLSGIFGNPGKIYEYTNMMNHNRGAVKKGSTIRKEGFWYNWDDENDKIESWNKV